METGNTQHFSRGSQNAVITASVVGKILHSSLETNHALATVHMLGLFDVDLLHALQSKGVVTPKTHMLTFPGGTFVIALLLYVFYRRRRGATYAQILHVPPRGPQTPQLTPTPMREKFAKHPIYHDVNYSIRSSRHESVTTFPPRVKLRSAPNGRMKHQRIKSGWQDPDAPKTPAKDSEMSFPKSATFFIDDSPKLKPRVPEKVHTATRPSSLVERRSSTNKDGFSMAVESAPSVGDCHSPLGSPPMLDDALDRWSWTNSQAPSTPRMLPKSRRTSMASTKYSAPRFRTVTSWARGQGERLRIDEEAPPLLALPAMPAAPTNPAPPPKKKSLKEKAKPNLTIRIDSPPSKKGEKGHKRAGSSLGALFRSTGNVPLISQNPEHGLPGDIEMDERKRSR